MICRYMKDTNQKTNIKPPDLWIHHDQMELKALEKSSINGEASTSGVASNTLPRSNNQDYNQENVHGNSSSLDKRTYVPSYMGKLARIKASKKFHNISYTIFGQFSSLHSVSNCIRTRIITGTIRGRANTMCRAA